jgi:hypothetical protein
MVGQPVAGWVGYPAVAASMMVLMAAARSAESLCSARVISEAAKAASLFRSAETGEFEENR